MTNDLIQEAANKEANEAILRYQKHIEWTIAHANRRRKENRKKRKVERNNRRKGRK